MVLETTTLVDRVPLPSVRQARDKHRVIDWLALFQGTCLVLIETASFAASTLLLVLGLPRRSTLKSFSAFSRITPLAPTVAESVSRRG